MAESFLNEQHNRQAPIMRFTPELDGKELRIDAALPDTQRGRDAATMIKEWHHPRACLSSFDPSSRAGPLACVKSGGLTLRRRRWLTQPVLRHVR